MVHPIQLQSVLSALKQCSHGSSFLQRTWQAASWALGALLPSDCYDCLSCLPFRETVPASSRDCGTPWHHIFLWLLYCQFIQQQMSSSNFSLAVKDWHEGTYYAMIRMANSARWHEHKTVPDSEGRKTYEVWIALAYLSKAWLVWPIGQRENKNTYGLNMAIPIIGPMSAWHI